MQRRPLGDRGGRRSALPLPGRTRLLVRKQFRAQGESLERALWTALRVLEERIALFKRLADDAVKRGLSTLAKTFEQRLEEEERNAGFLREAILRNPKE